MIISGLEVIGLRNFICKELDENALLESFFKGICTISIQDIVSIILVQKKKRQA